MSGASCSDPGDPSGGYTDVGERNLRAIPLPDGMRARAYDGRPLELRRLENVVAVLFDAPVTIRLEGRGPEREIPLRP